MTYRYGEDLSFCFVGHRAVALDLKRDRYFGVGLARSQSLKQALESGGEDHLAERLFGFGLVAQSGESHRLVAQAVRSPIRSAHEDHHGRAGATIADGIEVAGLIVRSWVALKRGPFVRVIRRIEARRRALPPPGPEAADQVQRAAGRFMAVRSLAPIEPICLLDSLALLAYLARRGLAADLVLAVDLDPFEAHAWVQHGDCALNETAHRAAMLTPILVV